jgi:hypothetical protein
VRHLDLFQDNFAEDGTLTGTARADCANDIASSNSPTILPGDSATITVSDPSSGIAGDPLSGVGPAVYMYVAVWPQGQAGKSGADLEAPETRSVGKRWPLVDTITHDGTTWYCFRGDSAITSAGFSIEDRYCFDLNDDVFTPCDTICYIFCAENNSGTRTYFSRRLDGQGDDFVTDDLWEALESPMEFTILPAGGWKRGGDILYVDDADDRGGPVQLYFDTAFDHWGVVEFGGMRPYIDRYDILAPSSVVANSLASRVKNVTTQIMDCYHAIIWSSGDLATGTIGDGTGNPEKSDDYALINTFLANRPDNPGLYFTGDDIHEEMATLNGASAINFRAQFYNYTLIDGDHVNAGASVSPCLVATGPCFIHSGVPDSLIAYGGCPVINDFDVIAPTGLSTAELQDAGGRTYVLSQATPTAQSIARVIGSGFSFHYIRDKRPDQALARAHHLKDAMRWMMAGSPVIPIGIDDTPQFALGDAYPNPFNPTTTIRYSIAVVGHVSLRIYNIAGQLVRTLVDEPQTPRSDGYSVTWDGRSESGAPAASGVYFYRLATKDFSQAKKLVLLK